MNKMNNIDKMKSENGYFEKDGKLYILTQQAYLDGTNDHPYYTAGAICTADTADEDGWQPYYRIQYEILDSYRPEDMQEDCACNWDEPDEIEESGEYSIEEDRCC